MIIHLIILGLNNNTCNNNKSLLILQLLLVRQDNKYKSGTFYNYFDFLNLLKR